MDDERKSDGGSNAKTVAELLAEARSEKSQASTSDDSKKWEHFDPSSKLLGPTTLTPPSYKALWRQKWDSEFLPISERTVLLSRVLSIPALIPWLYVLLDVPGGSRFFKACLGILSIASLVWFPMWWAGLGGRFVSWTSLWERESHPHVLLFIAWVILLFPIWGGLLRYLI